MESTMIAEHQDPRLQQVRMSPSTIAVGIKIRKRICLSSEGL